MSIKNYLVVLCFSFECVLAQSSRDEDFDMEALRKYSAVANQRSNQKTKEREGPDNPWMLLVLKKVHDGNQVSDDELQRIWEIYRAEKNHKIEDKLIAFRLIAEVEDISKWQKEFDAFAYSEDPQFVKTAIQTLFWKLGRGTEREKITLSNKTAVLEHLVQFAEDNKSDTTIDRETSKLLNLTKYYVGKTPPAEIQRPDRRAPGSPVEVTSEPNAKTPNSSMVGSLVQKIGKGVSLAVAGIIGIIIAAILIWRWKSKPTP